MKLERYVLAFGAVATGFALLAGFFIGRDLAADGKVWLPGQGEVYCEVEVK